MTRTGAVLYVPPGGMLVNTAAAPLPAPPTVPAVPTVRAGSHADAKRLKGLLQRYLAGIAAAGDRLAALVEVARGKAIWLMLEDARGRPFPTWEAFCLERQPWGLGIPAGAIELVLKERSDPQAQARRVLRADVPGRLQLGQRSRRRASDPATAGTKGPPPGSGRDYLLARLARDHRDTLEALERGEYRSVVEAARSAGILSKIVQLRPTPESYARSALALLDAAGVGRLVHYLTHPQDVPSSQSRRAAAA